MKAETIAKALGGRKAGSGWVARCPTHDDRTPSLSLTDGHDGRLLVKCSAGCSAHNVLSALHRLRTDWRQSSSPRVSYWYNSVLSS
jgi:putative DNA primase/helicase